MGYSFTPNSYPRHFTILRPVGRAVTCLSLEREVWDYNLGPVKLNTVQYCQRLATVATFLWKGLCFVGAMTRRWAPSTCYTLRRNTATITKEKKRFGFISTLKPCKPPKSELSLKTNFRSGYSIYPLTLPLNSPDAEIILTKWLLVGTYN